MEILGLKDSPVREAPSLPGKKPAEKPELWGEKQVPAPKESTQIDLSRNEKAIQALTENLNSFMKTMRYSLQFVPSRESGRLVVRVLDGDGKVVRQIPPEAMEALAAKLGSGIGLVVNEILE